MSQTDPDTGVIVALLERMRTQRLPRALDIQAKVNSGHPLDDYDLEFLEEVFSDSERLRPLWERHPELNEIMGKVIHLYHEITTKALSNEQGGPST